MMRKTRLLPMLAAISLAIVALIVLAWWAGLGPFSASSNGWEGRVVRPGDIPACGAFWRAVDAPNPSRDYNELRGIATSSPDDIWAVGTQGTEEFALTLIEHWDGTQWRVIPSPSIPTYSNHLYGADMLSHDDVWAVGASHRGTDIWRTLTLRWDGTRWNVVPSPNTGLISIFNAVSSLSKDDAWAVGESSTGNKGSGSRPLLAHWDGTTWSLMPAPANLQNGVLNSIAAISRDDIWVAGSSTDKSGMSETTLFLHWDGREWNKWPNNTAGVVWSLAAISQNEVWAVGSNGPQALVMRWDGTQWSNAPAPNPGSTNALNAVATTGPNDIWAVGSQSLQGLDRPLTAHWDGTTWSIAPSPSTGEYADILSAVVAFPGELAWSVGSSIADQNGTSLALIERYLNPCK